MDHECRDGEHVSAKSLLQSARRLAEDGQSVEAMGVLTQFLGEAPDNVEALRMRATLSLQLEDWDRALADYNRAIFLQPDCADCCFDRGRAFMLSGDVQAAIEDFSNCISREPKHAPALASRAAMLLQVNRLEEALEDITSAAAARQLNDRDIHNRAVVLAHLGRFQEAIREYERALELNPESGGTHNNLAWLLATSTDPRIRDGNRALKHALRAVELGKSDAWMDTLGAAYAECGDFETAVRAEKEAYRLSGYTSTAFQQRMSMYQHGVTYAAWLEARKSDDNV